MHERGILREDTSSTEIALSMWGPNALHLGYLTGVQAVLFSFSMRAPHGLGQMS